MSALIVQIKDSMKDAMRAKDKVRLNAVRMLLAQIKQVEVDERVELDDTRVLAILDKMMKQRRDSIQQFEAAGRQELADIEKQESDFLQTFMPQALSNDEIDQLVVNALAESGAKSMQDMGKVMAILKPQMQGRADMGSISAIIKAKLA